MTRSQYEQWREFALRMARTCYADLRRPTGAWVLGQVEDLLDTFADDYAGIEDWDSRCDDGYSACDSFADFEQEATPWFYFADDYPDDEDWEIPDDWEERAEERSELARQQWQNQYMGPVACCVRAGLDMATRVTGGVVGFTVADLRAMYPEGLPEYVQRHYDNPLDRVDAQDGIWL